MGGTSEPLGPAEGCMSLGEALGGINNSKALGGIYQQMKKHHF